MDYTRQVFYTSKSALFYISKKFTLALLDEFFQQTYIVLCDGDVDEADGRRQRLYVDPSFSFFSIAYSKCMETIATFVHQWCAQRLEVSSVKIQASSSFVTFSSVFKATVEMFILFSKRQLTALSFKSFGQYIISEMGAFHDCNIADNDKSNMKMKLLGLLYENDAKSGRVFMLLSTSLVRAPLSILRYL